MTYSELRRKWKAGASIDVDRVWADACAAAKKAREEKQRTIAAMIAAGQRQSREASK